MNILTDLSFKTKRIYRNGYVFQISKDPFCHMRFKGGGSSPDPPSSQMADTEIKQYAREELYPMVSAGMTGEGYGTSGTVRQQEKTLYGGIESAYKQGKSEFDSQMNRTLDPKDYRVRNYLTENMSRAYASQKDDVARGIRTQKVSDTDMSMSLAADYLASEKRMTVSGAQMYNQAQQLNLANQNRMGSFASNLASGLGAGAADYYYGQKMGA